MLTQGSTNVAMRCKRYALSSHIRRLGDQDGLTHRRFRRCEVGNCEYKMRLHIGGTSVTTFKDRTVRHVLPFRLFPYPGFTVLAASQGEFEPKYTRRSGVYYSGSLRRHMKNSGIYHRCNMAKVLRRGAPTLERLNSTRRLITTGTMVSDLYQ